MKDTDQTMTTRIVTCNVCSARLLEHDRFCRRCGASQVGDDANIENLVSSSRLTSALADTKPPRVVSRPLVNAVTATISARSSFCFDNRFAKSIVLALTSVAVWLVMILLSPLDAYVAAKNISSHVECEGERFL